MQRFLNIIFITATVITLASCGAKSGTDNAAVAEKKAKLEELKKQQADITGQITKLEADIIKLDPSSAKAEKAKLVTVDTIAPDNFTHYIDLQGKVDAQNIAYVTPRNGTGGQVKAVYVKPGDYVKKGQVLLKLDDAIIKQQIQNAKTQLAYAEDIYNRRNNLWKQSIGTEVELTTAKNNVNQAQKQLDILNEQLSFSNVTADIAGVADEVTIRVGELFSGLPTAGHIKIVNTSDLKITANVPENYLDKVKEGTNVLVTLPDINKSITIKVTVKGKIIDPNSRSFYIEAKLPADKDFRPNQLALVKIQDYNAANAITIPVNTLQTDEKGKFVMVAAKENNRFVARKRKVTEGQMYTDKLEVKDGLQKGDVIIVDGFQGLYEGQLITTDAK